jgi:hypothetical protein
MISRIVPLHLAGGWLVPEIVGDPPLARCVFTWIISQAEAGRMQVCSTSVLCSTALFGCVNMRYKLFPVVTREP